jgi:hypothetical protein
VHISGSSYRGGWALAGCPGRELTVEPEAGAAADVARQAPSVAVGLDPYKDCGRRCGSGG